MGQSGNTKAEHDEIEGPRGPSPRAADWLWRPRYAKLFWTSSALYWIGLYALLLVPNDQQNYYVANAMILLIFVFNPITVLAVLGYGFLKAKVACGEWTAGPGTPSYQPKSLIDPYSDPFDVRSGDLHLRHIGVIQD